MTASAQASAYTDSHVLNDGQTIFSGDLELCMTISRLNISPRGLGSEAGLSSRQSCASPVGSASAGGN